MAYSPPSRKQLRDALARDLRDPQMDAFTEPELNDLLNQAIVEVGRIYPKQEVQELSLTSDHQEQFVTDALRLFRVEVIRDGQVVAGVPSNGHDLTSQGGWDLHGGTLWMPAFIRSTLSMESSPTVRIWGYWPRELMTDAVTPPDLPDDQIADVDPEAEFGVRTYAALLGYQRLQNDRMLFQQWLTNTGNTDISPNQLAQTADMYQSQWREMRQRFRTLQRV